MSYRAGKVYVSVASVPEGRELEIPGLGSVPNGSSKEVDESQIQAYELNGFVWPESGELNIIIGASSHPVGPLSEEDPVDATSNEGDNE